MTPGRRSTEFWSLIGLGVLILANGFEAITLPWEQVQWYGGIVAAYIGGRSWVKAKAATPADMPSSPERREPS